MSELETLVMESPKASDPGLALDHARLLVYQFLAIAAADPGTERWSRLLEADFQLLVKAAMELIRTDPEARPAALSRGELPPETWLVAEPLLRFAQAGRVAMRSEYDLTFGLVMSKECPPYETEYCSLSFSVSRSQHLADIAGFYKAFGLAPSRDRPERHDHLVLELEFMAWLIAKGIYAALNGDEEHRRQCEEAQARFFADHLAWWIAAFALQLRRKADGLEDESELRTAPKSYQGAIGSLLAAFIPSERTVFGIDPAMEMPAPQPEQDLSAADCEGCPMKGMRTAPEVMAAGEGK